MSKQYDVAAYIGRFNPPCKHHFQTMLNGLEIASKLVVIVGSANAPRDIDNPFTANERIAMIRSMLTEEQLSHITFVPKNDLLYDNPQWIAGVEYHVNKEADSWSFESPSVVLIGSKSDESSWYLDEFPYWEKRLYPCMASENGHVRHASDVRAKLFGESDWCADEIMADYCEVPVTMWIKKFRENYPEIWKNLRDEYEHILNYKKAWEAAPYKPTFVTVDAVVTQSSNVLLVRRKAAPGKGLWALPGGFIEQNESLEDAMLRELSEETRIDVPKGKLRNCIKKTKVFDHPKRSKRGRTITHAYLIELNEPHGVLPRVKGSDDAEKAKWIPYSELVDMRNQVFEDHADIIHHLVGGFIR